MHAEVRPSFAFLVVTYNHQDYILEHLESIKYLVQRYGQDIDVDVIVNDDCSTDLTRCLLDSWLQINAGMFRNVKAIYNPKNLGTCASVDNMLTHMVADRCKLTAGDDVYSFENIFELTQHGSDVAMISGRALYLLGDVLELDQVFNALATATQAIYQHDTLLHRFKHFSYNNAPNLFYATECLLSSKVRAYLRRFDVIEDWPLQIAIAREFHQHRFILIDKILVYYRRTTGSTYIVANKRFMKDKVKIYDDLIQNEDSLIERIRLFNRKLCFKKQNRWINKLFNLDMYFFSISCLMRIIKIARCNNKIEKNISKHVKHFQYIQSMAAVTRMQFKLL